MAGKCNLELEEVGEEGRKKEGDDEDVNRWITHLRKRTFSSFSSAANSSVRTALPRK